MAITYRGRNETSLRTVSTSLIRLADSLDPAVAHTRQLNLYSSVGAGLSRDIFVVNPTRIAA